jgi:O-methyltransferase involved in polyketide biosynthesis
MALRAKQLDLWTADFLARHPDATVLQAGCGLDSRMLRVAPPADVRWFDVDLPETDPGSLEEMPADRPVLMIAEGLLIQGSDVRQLLQRLTDHFGSGELIFDAFAPWVTRLSKVFRWGISGATESSTGWGTASPPSETCSGNSGVARAALIQARPQDRQPSITWAVCSTWCGASGTTGL